ncbi:unnamed protein product [Rhizophagus irregularis]|nr:unnamed protein product [Rhizophagus irregularis]
MHHIKCIAYVSSIPEFAVVDDENDFLLIAIEQDKHLKNVGPSSNYGEVQIAAEILACACQNLHSPIQQANADNDVHIQKGKEGQEGQEDQEDQEDQKDRYVDQTIFAIRVIFTYVTFYKAEISSKYLKELDEGLPQEHKIA